MSWNSVTHSTSQSTPSAFRDEIAEVQSELVRSVDGLYPPLLNLVQNHILRIQPLVRAGFVLSTTLARKDNNDSRKKRVSLAAALEMLYVALGIHKLLIQRDARNQEDSIDKSVMGSMILAGDYCFSRAAALAAQTNSPDVVLIFSQALQRISESQLRRFFESGDNLSNDSKELFVAGAVASAFLVKQTALLQETYLALAAQLSTQIEGGNFSLPLLPLDLSSAQQDRWDEFADWLRTEFINE